MAHLIDKDILITEIEKKLADILVCRKNASTVLHLCKEILSFIDTIEVKEVDLEKKTKKSIIDECSEEDEEIVEAVNDYVKNLDIFFSEMKIGDKNILSKEFREKVQSWLKSIKERDGNFDDGYKVGFSAAKYNQWKPSDEQLNTLKQWLKDKRYDGDTRYCFPIFDSLYQDLKKLKDE